jgi:hypothetical protein
LCIFEVLISYVENPYEDGGEEGGESPVELIGKTINAWSRAAIGELKGELKLLAGDETITVWTFCKGSSIRREFPCKAGEQGLLGFKVNVRARSE